MLCARPYCQHWGYTHEQHGGKALTPWSSQKEGRVGGHRQEANIKYVEMVSAVKKNKQGWERELAVVPTLNRVFKESLRE